MGRDDRKASGYIEPSMMKYLEDFALSDRRKSLLREVGAINF